MRRLALAGLLAACSSSSTVATAVIPPLGAAATTETQTVVPTHAFLTDPDPNSPGDPATLPLWMQAGYGATTIGAGESLMPTAPPNLTPPAAGANPTLLVRFAHLTDTHLADDESPIRVCEFDQPGEVSGAFRAQEGDQCRVLDAVVRTINALHQTLPLSFVLTGGDNTDNTQKNEAEWFMQIMDGSPRVKCDSGDPNDPVPGANNDGKDPFAAPGLPVPWYWVNGNHDVLIQGNYPVTDMRRMQALGTDAATGTRDYTQPGGPLFNGPVVPDAERLPMLRTELMALVAADKDGHGIGAAQVASGKATYSFDVSGTSLRFISIDTGCETGGDAGIIHQADVDSTIKPLLDQAKSDGKSVVLASHHSSSGLSDGSGFGGTQQADAITNDQWQSFLGGYDNIVFYMVGHAHANRVRYVAPASGHGWWEVMASALADYPHQFRMVEIWDDDNGWVRLRTVVTDYATDGDGVAAEGKMLGVEEAVAGWASDGSGLVTDRNVELFIPKP